MFIIKRLVAKNDDSNFSQNIEKKLNFIKLDIKPDTIVDDIKDGQGTINITMNNGDKLSMNYCEAERFNTLVITDGSQTFETNVATDNEFFNSIKDSYLHFLRQIKKIDFPQN